MMNLRHAFCILAPLAGMLGGCGPAAGAGEQRAPVMFADNCAPCHGIGGQGNPDIEAPSIAGLPEWYVLAQLHKFRDGIRGAHADDYAGLRMRPMSRTIPATDVEPIAAYVAGLSPAIPDETVKGDEVAGKASFATCVACHGAKGEGNEALKAPPISQLDDWYMVTQINHFKKGVRGANPKDTTGAQMAPMARTLADDQAVVNVVAYVNSLR